MCGEQYRCLRNFRYMWGSPPRVRGTGPGGQPDRAHGRITPACAGNRIRGRAAPQAVKDHPRVCGEQRQSPSSSQLAVGSPPRVRGTVGQPFQSIRRHGITPACAGNSISAIPPATASKDHPRVCGEQRTSTLPALLAQGSPPRVRGTVFFANHGHKAKGITPACAGNRWR